MQYVMSRTTSFMIAILSDIHGNYIALEEVLKAVDKMGITEVYALGDTVGYYSQVNEVINELRQRDAHAIMGNHDWYMAAESFCARSNTVNDTLAYQRKVITKENLDWIKNLPLYLEIEGISMVHGGWTDPLDEYLTQPSKEYFEKVGGKYFCSGHTHLPRLEDYGDKIYCNPGSVGQPRDNDNRASFATWDGTKFELHRVDYDFEKVGELMEKAGFSGYYYERLATGAKDNGWYKDKDNV
jgi:putative phosphoesterase